MALVILLWHHLSILYHVTLKELKSKRTKFRTGPRGKKERCRFVYFFFYVLSILVEWKRPHFILTTKCLSILISFLGGHMGADCNMMWKIRPSSSLWTICFYVLRNKTYIFDTIQAIYIFNLMVSCLSPGCRKQLLSRVDKIRQTPHTPIQNLVWSLLTISLLASRYLQCKLDTRLLVSWSVSVS